MDFNLATKKAVTKRIKQAVAEPIDSTASGGEITTKRDVLASAAEAQKLIKESAQSAGKPLERKSRACTESHDSRQDEVFHEVAARAETTAREVGEVRGHSQRSTAMT